MRRIRLYHDRLIHADAMVGACIRHTIALQWGRPCAGFHTSVVSRWLVIPNAAISFGDRFAGVDRRGAPQISTGLCPPSRPGQDLLSSSWWPPHRGDRRSCSGCWCALVDGGYETEDSATVSGMASDTDVIVHDGPPQRWVRTPSAGVRVANLMPELAEVAVVTPDRGMLCMAHERDRWASGTRLPRGLTVGYSPIDGPESVGLADLPHVRSR